MTDIPPDDDLPIYEGLPPGVSVIQIEDELKRSFRDYSMSVIVSRARPDVRVGLNPFHRRILYAMGDMGNTHDRPYRKSAVAVGEERG